jgi:hypothetical protein
MNSWCCCGYQARVFHFRNSHRTSSSGVVWLAGVSPETASQQWKPELRPLDKPPFELLEATFLRRRVYLLAEVIVRVRFLQKFYSADCPAIVSDKRSREQTQARCLGVYEGGVRPWALSFQTKNYTLLILPCHLHAFFRASSGTESSERGLPVGASNPRELHIQGPLGPPQDRAGSLRS